MITRFKDIPIKEFKLHENDIVMSEAEFFEIIKRVKDASIGKCIDGYSESYLRPEVLASDFSMPMSSAILFTKVSKDRFDELSKEELLSDDYFIAESINDLR